MKEHFLAKKLEQRAEQSALRRLRLPDGHTDFCSNDYLGIATNFLIEKAWPLSARPLRHGSGGSRLLAGNYALIEETEQQLAAFHDAAAGLIFNSGYDANLGLLSSVPQRGDTVLYDYLSHASIRDGIRLSFAQSFSFLHNDVGDLEKKLQAATRHSSAASHLSTASHTPAADTLAVDRPGFHPSGTALPAAGHPSASLSSVAPNPADSPPAGNIFVVTESVFSMDGDQAPLQKIAALCATYGAQLIVDEAHATGVIGKKGEGLVQDLGIQNSCFARVHTFGKAVGCHGAVVLGSERLREYLINFSRAFIYTTALPESSILAIRMAYQLFPQMEKERHHLQQLITRFQQASLAFQRLESTTPIQGVIVPGNEAIRSLAHRLQTAGLDVRPILYPTVPKGSERLRIILHVFNTIDQLDQLIANLQ